VGLPGIEGKKMGGEISTALLKHPRCSVPIRSIFDLLEQVVRGADQERDMFRLPGIHDSRDISRQAPKGLRGDESSCEGAEHSQRDCRAHASQVALPPRLWKGRLVFPRHTCILLGSADEFGTVPFTGPRSGRTALVSGNAAYVLTCKALYTSSILVIPLANVDAMKRRGPANSEAKAATDSKMKSGLPGTPEERRRLLREAMDKNAETLRRLAE
jgi:hypothetical protein